MPRTTESLTADTSERSRSSEIKCVVWDLDNTLWQGVLLENDSVQLHARVPEIVRTLDERGILQSIASKNDHDLAISKLNEFGLGEFFLHPQISWNSKVFSLERIAQSLNIGLDALALVDDDPFERSEVGFSLPQIECIDAAALEQLIDMPRLNPVFISDDSKRRRQMYLSALERDSVEAEFAGTAEEFLASLGMVLSIAPATEADLIRAEELTRRTNQLNTTGRTYAYEELDHFRQSPQHQLLIAGLEDCFGSYGKIGLALIECEPQYWIIKLLLMSCRVMSRGVGGVLISHVLQRARASVKTVRADFVPNDRNRMMNVTYRFAGFKEIHRGPDQVVLEHDLSHIQRVPEYFKLEITN